MSDMLEICSIPVSYDVIGFLQQTLPSQVELIYAICLGRVNPLALKLFCFLEYFQSASCWRLLPEVLSF
jgi:hypothetical protein